jgi:hypothetical protein
MNEMIIKEIGGCKVKITFGESNPGLKEDVLWLMFENYKSRITEQAEEQTKAAGKKKSA